MFAAILSLDGWPGVVSTPVGSGAADGSGVETATPATRLGGGLFRASRGRYTGGMSSITPLELQQQTASLLERVRAGERLMIVCDGWPVAELRPASDDAMPPRPRGRCAGLFRVPDDFDAPLPEEILRGFEGQ